MKNFNVNKLYNLGILLVVLPMTIQAACPAIFMLKAFFTFLSPQGFFNFCGGSPFV
jgi:hypothetical protein